MKNGLRVLAGFLTRGGSDLRVICPNCGRWHSHGADKGLAPGDTTHRAAHCRVPAPGYYITVQPEPYKRDWATTGDRFSRACKPCGTAR